jgi:large conductance mechanosensitive channel
MASCTNQRARLPCALRRRIQEAAVSMLKEFREFAVRGNVVDMAVGIIIGAAFGKIVSSLVADVITPPLGLVIGGVDFSNLTLTLREAINGQPAVVLGYGKFLQSLFDFCIVAFAIFLLVKGVNRLKRKEEAAPTAPPPRSEVLLEEIRDELRKR